MHIEITFGSVDDAEKAMRLFSEKLSLPLAWPFQSHKGKFSSGGDATFSFSEGSVSLGNVYLSLLYNHSPRTGLSYYGLAPRGSLSEVLTALDARGIKHHPPDPYYEKDASGENHLLWTEFGLSSPATAGAAFFETLTFGADKSRSRLQRELRSRGGGPLGVESVMELVIGVRDIAAAKREWSLLLGRPRAGEESVWQVGSGPGIRLIAAQEDHLAMLRVKVSSLEQARTFLKRENLLGRNGAHEISLERSRLAGADIRLVE